MQHVNSPPGAKRRITDGLINLSGPVIPAAEESPCHKLGRAARDMALNDPHLLAPTPLYNHLL